ncbi:Ig-like domain-containing protein [Agromyces bauzanensis]
MRFPIHVPDTVDDGRRPVRIRLAALGVSVVLGAAVALALPLDAQADEATDGTATAAAIEQSAAVDEPAATEERAPAEEPAAVIEEAPALEEPAPAAEATPDPAAEPAESATVAAKPEPEASGAQALVGSPEPAELGPEPANQAPVAVDDSYVAEQDTVLYVAAPGMLANDYDPDGDAIRFMHSVSVPFGKFGYYGGLWMTYTPAPGFVGTDTLQYTIWDEHDLESEPATITVEVVAAGGANAKPTPVEDHAIVLAGTTHTAAAPGVLANDSDPDGDPLTVMMSPQAQHGDFHANADGSWTYTPDAGFLGLDNVDIPITDGGAYVSSRLWIEVVPELKPPVVEPLGGPVAEPDTLTAVAGELAVLPAPGVLANDSDPDGDPLELVALSQPEHGVLYYWSADGDVQYVPNDGFSGTEVITYTVGAGTATATSTLTITVTEPENYAPQAWEDEVALLAGTTLSVGAPGVLGNDSDLDGDPLTVTWHSDPQHGAISIAADGSFAYTPDAGFAGTDSVLYEASDGVATATAFLVVNVIPADAAPHPSVIGDHYTAVSGALFEVAAPGVLGNDLAPTGPVSVIAVEPAEHGTIEIDPDGSLRYTSDPGYTGVDTVRYTITDGTAQADGLLSITVLDPAGEPALPGDTEEPGRPAEAGGPAADPVARPQSASTDAATLARTGFDAGIAAAVAALLAALGIALRQRRRSAH